jgi:hypothetical protein
LPEAEKESLEQNIEAQVLRRLGIIIAQNLDEKGMAEYGKILDKEYVQPEEIEKFLKERMPGYELKIREEMDKFIEQMIAAFGS